MTSVINLAKSRSDIEYPIKSDRRHTICISKFSLIRNWDRMLLLGKVHKCQSLITMRATEDLNTVSAEDLENVSSDTIHRSLKRSFMNSESAIQLKRTYPFTSMLEKEEGGKEQIPSGSGENEPETECAVEMLLVDDNASEIHKEQNDAFDFEEVEAPVYEMDQSFIDLCGLYDKANL